MTIQAMARRRPTARRSPGSGDYYAAALAGDRLVDGVYEPIEVEQLGEGVWRGYSETLGLHVCWEHGRLRFFDSMTESYLLSHKEEVKARRDAEAEIRRLRARPEELARGARRIRQFAFSLYALIRLSPIVIAGHHQESESSEFIMSATTGLNTSLNLMR